MAILQGGIMQGFSGKVGKIVGARVNGQDTIRSYQPIVSNPKSPKQSGNRELLRRAAIFVSQKVDRAYRIDAFSKINGSTAFGVAVASCLSYLRANENLSFKPIIEGQISQGVAPRYDIVNGSGFTGGTPEAPEATFKLGGFIGTRFFGSDVLLDNNTLYLLLSNGKIAVETGLKELELVRTSIVTTNFLAADGIGQRVKGLQLSNAACGEWKYIYSVKCDSILTGHAPSYDSSEVAMPYQLAFVGENSMISMYLQIAEI